MSDSKLPLADHLAMCAMADTLDYDDHCKLEEAEASYRQQHEALKRADMFITNGIELGKIRMPDAGCPDPAHETPGIIKAAIAAAEGEPS